VPVGNACESEIFEREISMKVWVHSDERYPDYTLSETEALYADGTMEITAAEYENYLEVCSRYQDLHDWINEKVNRRGK